MASVESFISTIFVASSIAINPIVPITTPLIIADDLDLIELPFSDNIILSPAEFFANSVGNVFEVIWQWTLMNVLTPLIVIAFLILFFAMQYYMIKFYIFVIKSGIPFVRRVSTLYKLKRDNILTGLHK